MESEAIDQTTHRALLATNYLWGKKITHRLPALCDQLKKLDSPYHRQWMENQLAYNLHALWIDQNALGLDLIRDMPKSNQRGIELPDPTATLVLTAEPIPMLIPIPTEEKIPMEEKKSPHPPKSPDTMPQPTGIIPPENLHQKIQPTSAPAGRSKRQPNHKFYLSPTQERFQRIRISGNGECGYTALKISRDEAYDLIKKNIEVVRDILKPAVMEVLIHNAFINYLWQRDDVRSSPRLLEALRKDFQKMQSAASSGGQMSNGIQSNLSHYADNLNIINYYLDYDVKDRRIDAGWAHPCVLQAIAHIQKFTLRIWIIENDQRVVSHPHYPEYHPPGAKESIHLLFVNGNHFDRLEVRPPRLNLSTEKTTASAMPPPTEIPPPMTTSTPTEEKASMSEDTQDNTFDFPRSPLPTDEKKGKKEKSEADDSVEETSDQENSEEETQDSEDSRESFPPQQIMMNSDGTTPFTHYIQNIFLSSYADVGLKERFIKLQNQYLGLQKKTGGKTPLAFDLTVDPPIYTPDLRTPRISRVPTLIKHHQPNGQALFFILGLVQGVPKYTKLNPIPELQQFDFNTRESLSLSTDQNKEIYEEIRSKQGHLPAEHALMSLNDPPNFIAEFEKDKLFAKAPPFCCEVRVLVRRFTAHCMEAERPIGGWVSQKLRYSELWDARHIELLYFKFLCVEIAKRNGDERNLKELVETFIKCSETTLLSGYDDLKDDFKALMKKEPKIQKYFGMTSDKKQAAEIRRLKDKNKKKSLEINTLNKSLHKNPQGSQQASESQTGIINAKLLEENNQKLKAELLAELRNDPQKLPEKTDVIDHLSAGKKVKDQNSNSYKPVLASAPSSSRSPKAKKQRHDDVKDKIINAPQPEAGGCILL